MGFQDQSEMASCHLLPRPAAAVWEEAMWILKSQENYKENEENAENGFWIEENEDDNVEKMGLGNSDPTTCFLDLQLQIVWEEGMGILGTSA